MNRLELLRATIDKNDPYKASKELQLEYWWGSFQILFRPDSQERLKFFLEILSDDECWVKTQTIPHMKLNRRMVARKMVHSRSRTGKTNPLSYYERYQVACRCCLEEDIAALFGTLKRSKGINAEDTTSLKNFVKKLNNDVCCEQLLAYWSHIVTGCPSELKLEGKNLYEYGLNCALNKCTHVEAVEYFWNKIKSLPEDKLSFRQKHEIFVLTTIASVKHSDIFEFCISQVSSNMYPEILKRDFERNGIYGGLKALIHPRRFDLIKTLFDCLEPEDITVYAYGHLLQSLNWDQYPTHYTSEAVQLFVHMWMKEGFDKHRAYVLKEEKIDFSLPGTIVVPLVQQNYIEIVWAVLDNTSPDKTKAFVKSEQAKYIYYLINTRGDTDSANKLLSYKVNATAPVNPNTSPHED